MLVEEAPVTTWRHQDAERGAQATDNNFEALGSDVEGSNITCLIPAARDMQGVRFSGDYIDILG